MALANLISNVVLYEGPKSNSEWVALTKTTSTDAYAVGDLIEADDKDGTCKVVNNAAKSTFLGIGQSTVLTSDTTSYIHTAIHGIAEMPLASGEVTIYFGECACYSTGANGTTWSIANSATNGVFHVLSATITAGNTGLLLFDPYTVRAVTGIGFFELPA